MIFLIISYKLKYYGLSVILILLILFILSKSRYFHQFTWFLHLFHRFPRIWRPFSVLHGFY